MNVISAADTRTDWWSSPYLVGLPFLMIVFGLGTRTEFGIPGLFAGAAFGLGWGLLVGWVAKRVRRNDVLRAKAEDALVFCAVVAMSFVLVGGIVIAMLIVSALDEPSTTSATVLALARPTLPYFIITNTSMELLFVPGVVFFGWRPGRRRTLILRAVAGYFAMRVWTYLFYAEDRTLNATAETLSRDDMAWYRDSLATDYGRIALNVVVFVLFLAAAFLSAHRRTGRATPRTSATTEHAGSPSAS
jgi:hypothetical protein